MKKMAKLLAMMLVGVCLLSGCNGKTETPKEPEKEEVGLDKEDTELLEEIGDDVNVVAEADFASTVAAFDEHAVGGVYQLTGVYHSEKDGEEYPTLSNGDGSASVQLRYLNSKVEDGETYVITGIVAQDTHDDHAHIVFDVITVDFAVNE